MAAGSEEIRWSDLQHAFGAASNVPGLLTAVRKGGRKGKKALAELYNTIWHQGSVYSASAAAVPFLAEMAADRDMPLPVRSQLVHLLFLIASGGDETCTEATAHACTRLTEDFASTSLPCELWCGIAGLVVASGVSDDRVIAALARPPHDADPLVRAGSEVLRQLAESGTASAEAVRATAALDEELGDCFDDEIEAVRRDDPYVELLVERMTAAGA